jgi:N-formylglutamate deformylase
MSRSAGPGGRVDVAFDVVPGDAPVLVHVPHAGLVIPADVRAGLVLDEAALAAEILVMTDHGTAELAVGLADLGATLLVNRTSRLVVDVERYADPLEELMEGVGMGAVYTRTSTLAPLRDEDPKRSARLRADLVTRFHVPWHAALTKEVARLIARHGCCTIIDLHSYPSRALPYELSPGTPRPEVCIGTDRTATPPALARRVEEVLADHGFATARDTPFSGALTPAAFAGDPHVVSVMIEVRRDVIVDEATGVPHAGLADLRGALSELVAELAPTPV